MVCVDSKGEPRSTRHRSTGEIGHQIFRLDPFDLLKLGPGDCLNPLIGLTRRKTISWNGAATWRSMPSFSVILNAKEPHWGTMRVLVSDRFY